MRPGGYKELTQGPWASQVAESIFTPRQGVYRFLALDPTHALPPLSHPQASC